MIFPNENVETTSIFNGLLMRNPVVGKLPQGDPGPVVHQA
jgi:hypothetical protein